MKTLFIHNTVPEYRIEFMNQLSKMTEVEFVITTPSLEKEIYQLVSDEDFLKATVVYLPENFSRYMKIKKYISDSMICTVILPPADNVNQYVLGLYSMLCALRYHKNIIYWTEKWEANREKQPIYKTIKNFIHRKMIKSLAKQCQICIAAGSRSKEYLLKLGIDKDKIEIAYDSSVSRQSEMLLNITTMYDLKENSKVILYLGRMIRRKGCKILIQAFQRIVEGDSNCYLIMAGQGDELAKCKKLVEEYCIQNVIFTGKVSPDQRAAFYRLAKVFVLPSYTEEGVIEAWGLTVNEALEYGTPVVATTAVGAAYDVLNGKNGCMVEENSVEALVEGINRFLYHGGEEEIREACICSAAKYSVENMAKSFVKAIKRVEGKF